MNYESEQRLRQLFAEQPAQLPDSGLETGVRRRIRKIRLLRRGARILAWGMLFIAVVVVSPFVVQTSGRVAESSAVLADAVGGFAATPLAFAIGIVVALYALLELRTR